MDCTKVQGAELCANQKYKEMIAALIVIATGT